MPATSCKLDSIPVWSFMYLAPLVAYLQFTFIVLIDAVVLLVRHWTCDLQVAGSSPGCAPLRIGFGQATYTCVLPLTKQYNLVPAKGVISLAGKITAGLVESNGSLPPGL